MPARVEFRLGSIFDEPCDVLVIPSSTTGTVTPDVQQEMQKVGIPLPEAMAWGSVALAPTWIPRFSRVAYAATISGEGTSLEIVKRIGTELGSIAAASPRNLFGGAGRLAAWFFSGEPPASGLKGFVPRFFKISAPLLGAGSGDLEPRDAALALRAGFVSTAPASALLLISIRDQEDYEEVAEVLRRPTIAPRRDASAAPNAGATSETQRSPSTASFGAGLAPAPRPATPAPAPQAQPAPSKPSAGSGPSSPRSGVFVSYSHADAEWLERLQKHLRPLQREGVEVWDDTRLRPGEPWREKIREALAAAKVAILLVSPDFLDSEFIAADELPPLLKAAEEDGATILPVIVSHCRFDRTPSLSRFQAVNDPAKPLVRMGRGNRDKVFDDVARAVEDALGK
ncbi:MAG TPA: toll/interleukin-1 receptor domain-containing protein [Longimicrobium sp.]|nr:toll/interleukin-1 receptor domain-containing protein [Longimicrobium sp.]